MASHDSPVSGRVWVGLVVTFAAITKAEEHAVKIAWDCAARGATAWMPAFATFGLEPLAADARGADLIVYLGESSRFQSVLGDATQNVPVVLVKSTIEELLDRPVGAAMRYRMCTGVNGIAQALAAVAPRVPTVDWQTLPWPAAAAHLMLDEAERRYVTRSMNAFREAAQARGIPWVDHLKGDQPFSVFLTMHDPLAARLADAALKTWPECTVLAADGMSAMHAPDGASWSERLVRVRHWSPHSRSASNRLFRATAGEPLPDLDSPGMVFGTLCFLDGVFAAGAAPGRLEDAGQQTGPLGPMRMTASGHPEPERIIVFQGSKMRVVTI
jgi:hypothetical protein